MSSRSSTSSRLPIWKDTESSTSELEDSITVSGRFTSVLLGLSSLLSSGTSCCALAGSIGSTIGAAVAESSFVSCSLGSSAGVNDRSCSGL